MKTKENTQDEDTPHWEAGSTGTSWSLRYHTEASVWVTCDINLYQACVGPSYYSVSVSIPGTYRRYRRETCIDQGASSVLESVMNEAVEVAQELLNARAELLLDVAKKLTERRVPAELEVACLRLLEHLAHNTSDAAVKELTALVQRASALLASQK